MVGLRQRHTATAALTWPSAPIEGERLESPQRQPHVELLFCVGMGQVQVRFSRSSRVAADVIDLE